MYLYQISQTVQLPYYSTECPLGLNIKNFLAAWLKLSMLFSNFIQTILLTKAKKHVSEYDQEMPQSQTTDQHMPPQGRDVERL